MPRVNSCCCGCSLRTGTEMILWHGVIMSILGIVTCTTSDFIVLNVPFPHITMYVLTCAIILGIHIIGIYGVEMDRPAFLKPFLAYQVFCMVMIIMDMLVLAFIGTVLLSYLLGTSERGGRSGGYEHVILTYEFIHLLALGLAWHFFVVVLSFYKELKEAIPRQ